MREKSMQLSSEAAPRAKTVDASASCEWFWVFLFIFWERSEEFIDEMHTGGPAAAWE